MSSNTKNGQTRIDKGYKKEEEGEKKNAHVGIISPGRELVYKHTHTNTHTHTRARARVSFERHSDVFQRATRLYMLASGSLTIMI